MDTHLARIYNQEITRPGKGADTPNPQALQDWWWDVDGCGSTIDQWMKTVCGPLLMTLGQLDLLFDHPPCRRAIAC
jgi:hypothetical protein